MFRSIGSVVTAPFRFLFSGQSQTELGLSPNETQIVRQGARGGNAQEIPDILKRKEIRLEAYNSVKPFLKAADLKEEDIKLLDICCQIPGKYKGQNVQDVAAGWHSYAAALGAIDYGSSPAYIGATLRDHAMEIVYDYKMSHGEDGPRTFNEALTAIWTKYDAKLFERSVIALAFEKMLSRDLPYDRKDPNKGKFYVDASRKKVFIFDTKTDIDKLLTDLKSFARSHSRIDNW